MPNKQDRIKVRRVWKINPKTKVKKSTKLYRRAKERANLKKLLDGEMP